MLETLAGGLRMAVLVAAAAVGGCTASPDSAGKSASIDTTVTADDWPSFGRDGSEQHYSPLNQIALRNIGKLGLAWHFDLEPGFSVSAPVMAQGKLFVTTGNSHIRALDPVTGKLLWEFDAKTRELAKYPLQMSWGNKGLAYWNGRVFIATTDGRVIAIDADTGKSVWEEREYPVDEMRYTNGPPRVYGGKVLVGHGGADITPIRGYVTAYDAETGKRLWRFYTTPSDPSKPAESKADAVMRPTWKGNWFGKGAGGTVWNAMSYDPKLNLIYLGVGNGFPYNQKFRSPGGGDNLFLASVVAINADTGEYVWHYQTCPAEQWDCTATMDMTLADIAIGGRLRKVLIQTPKNGFVYVIDRATGELISAEKYAKVTWAQRIDMKTGRPVENPGIRYETTGKMFELWPGPQGAHSWLPQAFSARTGLVYIPIIEMGAFIGPDHGPAGFGSGTGSRVVADPPNLPGSRRSFLKAWDPVRQKAVWTVDLPGSWPGGVLATAGDLIFQGRIDGQLIAYDARNGKQVWSFKAQAPIVAPPISYRIKGRQYVTVLTGNGSQGGGIFASGNEAWRTDYRLPRHVLTFALDGRNQLPSFEAPPLTPPDDASFRPEPKRVSQGAMIFATNSCLVCHGMNAVGGGSAPDLRYSPVIVDKDTFRMVVKGGALKANGMPVFPQIKDDDLEVLRDYLRMRAKQAPAELAAVKSGNKSAAAPKTVGVATGT